jgi:hypothetical protein
MGMLALSATDVKKRTRTASFAHSRTIVDDLSAQSVSAVGGAEQRTRAATSSSMVIRFYLFDYL